VCVGRILLVDFTLPLDSDFIWIYLGYLGPYGPKSRQRDFSPNFYDFLQNKNHGFFFSCGYDGQVCVGRIILVDFTLPLDSDFIWIYLGVSGAIWPQKQG